MAKFLISLLFILSNLSLHAQQSLESRMESASVNNKTIQCDFTQSKKVKNIKDLIESKGNFYYDNGGMMSLMYTDPAGDKIVINNEKFTIITAGKQIAGEAEDNPMMMQICGMLQACMSGDITKLGRGWQTEVTEEEDIYNILLTPTDRRTSKYINSLVMIFDKKDMTLNTLQMNETSGGYTSYTFTNKEINQEIDPLKFE